MKVAVFFHRLGPYHVARLEALSKKCEVVGVEYSQEDKTYDWDRVDRAVFSRERICDDDRVVSRRKFRELIFALLDRIRPDVIFLPGWSYFGNHFVASWARHHAVPLVLMCESQRVDKRRLNWLEFVKREILKAYSGVLVGGSRSRDYVTGLGVREDLILDGYDVVDNGHFSGNSGIHRHWRGPLLERPGIPWAGRKFFLSCGRFVEKKNLRFLLQVYAAYKSAVGGRAWALVLLGSGPLEDELRGLSSSLKLDLDVHFAGFGQYADLPRYYGAASCLVHCSTVEQWGLVVNEAMASGLPVLVSRSCGCVPELVVDGRNGFSFDPRGGEELLQLMVKMSGPGSHLKSMGAESRRVVRHWSPQYFARNSHELARRAMESGPSPATFMGRLSSSVIAAVGPR